LSPSEPGSRRWTRWRRLTQAGVALFYLALPWVNAAGFREVAGTLASLKVGPVDLTEPVAALAAALAGLTVSWELVLGVAPVAALALLAGPVFCSWVCPWGLISEGVDRLRQRLGPRPWRGSPWVGVRRLRWAALAGVLLAGALLAAPLGALLSAPRLITTLPLEAVWLRVVSPVTGGLLGALLLLELVGPRRLWCRALCPVGALANLLRTPRTLRVAWDPARCACARHPSCFLRCPWGVDPRQAGRYDGCSNCLVCVDGCPSGALRATASPRQRCDESNSGRGGEE